jgi:tetratricopeptide (TPR) repeat protein
MNGQSDLEGNLRDVPLPEILKRIFDERRTGTLKLVQQAEEIHLFFEKGEIRTVISTAEGRHLGDALCRSGFVSREAVAVALEEVGAAGHGRLGRQLLRKGMISEYDLDAITLKHFVDIVLSALAWKSAEFRFESSTGELDPDVAIPHSIGTVLVAAIRHLPKSEHFVDLLGDLERFASAVPTTIEREEVLLLEPAEAYILSLCDGTIPIRLILQLASSRLAAARTLCALGIGGLVEFCEVPRPAVAASGSAVVADSAPAVPKPEWSGYLDEVSLPEILKTIFDERRTGTLAMTRPKEEIHLFFESGELRAAISTAEGRRLGETLCRREIISEEALATTLDAMRADGHGRIGRYLVQAGLITAGVLAAEAQKHFEEIVLSGFSWRRGDFEFRSSTGQLDPDVTLPLSIADVLMLGVRQLPEGERFVELLGDLDRFAMAVPATVERYEALRLEPSEAYLLSLCDGKTQLRSILQLAPSRLAAARTLYALVISGLVELTAETIRVVPAQVPVESQAGAVWTEGAEPDIEVRAQLASSNYLEARILLERKDYFGAIVLLQESVRLASDNSEYHFRLAGALARNVSWRGRAAHHYGQALVLDPVRQELMREYAEFLAIGGKYREAQAIAQRLVKRYPGEPRNQELLARCDQGVLGADELPTVGESDDESAKRSLLSRLWSRRTP